MDTLPFVPPACNAVGPPAAVRTEFVTGAYSDAKFEAWLDVRPDRKRAFLAESPEEQAASRIRVARLWVLRTSPMPADLHAAVTLADELQGVLLDILKKYSKREARLVLEAAGLRIPGPNDMSFSWGGDHFAHSYRGARSLLAPLEDFSEVVWAALFLMLPDQSEEPLVREAA